MRVIKVHKEDSFSYKEEKIKAMEVEQHDLTPQPKEDGYMRGPVLFIDQAEPTEFYFFAVQVDTVDEERRNKELSQ